jgi:hypothetical protein
MIRDMMCVEGESRVIWRREVLIKVNLWDWAGEV